MANGDGNGVGKRIEVYIAGVLALVAVIGGPRALDHVSPQPAKLPIGSATQHDIVQIHHRLDTIQAELSVRGETMTSILVAIGERADIPRRMTQCEQSIATITSQGAQPVRDRLARIEMLLDMLVAPAPN